MRTTQPFILSVGIHIALITLFFGGISVLRKQEPIFVEKIALKILSQPSTQPVTPLVQPKKSVPEPPKPTAVPKSVQPHVVTPPKIQPAVENTAPVPKAVIPAPQPPVPVIAKASLSEPTEVKVPAAQPKEQPPKHQKEEYVYAHADKVQEILNQRKVFPKIARNLKQSGEVIIAFDFTPSGEANNIRIVKSSGFESLDDAAKELIKSSASLFPKPRENVPVTVPIEYMR
ncbi:energy transducer TonB [Sulfuricurvum sp.]|uniref:energy transducer TonB n=1 Tax=Sulfuricurvum sp. TaxID=2025608 RepID=UPI00261DFF56|nr:TonB family protein [Sulfuricurvum sp.]MDD2267619.1 TonB family protein [Sulfuricurvum sp.]